MFLFANLQTHRLQWDTRINVRCCSRAAKGIGARHGRCQTLPMANSHVNSTIAARRHTLKRRALNKQTDLSLSSLQVRFDCEARLVRVYIACQSLSVNYNTWLHVFQTSSSFFVAVSVFSSLKNIKCKKKTCVPQQRSSPHAATVTQCKLRESSWRHDGGVELPIAGFIKYVCCDDPKDCNLITI